MRTGSVRKWEVGPEGMVTPKAHSPLLPEKRNYLLNQHPVFSGQRDFFDGFYFLLLAQKKVAKKKAALASSATR